MEIMQDAATPGKTNRQRAHIRAKEAAVDRSLADLRRTIEADGQPLVALVNNAAVVSVRE